MLMDFNSIVSDFARGQRIAASVSDIDRIIGLKPEDFGTPLTPEEIEATRVQASARLSLQRSAARLSPASDRMPMNPYDVKSMQGDR